MGLMKQLYIDIKSSLNFTEADEHKRKKMLDEWWETDEGKELKEQKRLENVILPWWDNLSDIKQEELTSKYFPRFSVSMMDSYEIEKVYDKEHI